MAQDGVQEGRQPESEPSEAGAPPLSGELRAPLLMPRPAGVRWRSCDMCLMQYSGDGSAELCARECPRRAGWSRGQIARALRHGQVVPGLSRHSPLLQNAHDQAVRDVELALGRLTNAEAESQRAAAEVEAKQRAAAAAMAALRREQQDMERLLALELLLRTVKSGFLG